MRIMASGSQFSISVPFLSLSPSLTLSVSLSTRHLSVLAFSLTSALALHHTPPVHRQPPVLYSFPSLVLALLVSLLLPFLLEFTHSVFDCLLSLSGATRVTSPWTLKHVPMVAESPVYSL